MSMNTELKQLGCSPNIVQQLVRAHKTLQQIQQYGQRSWDGWIEIGQAIEAAHADMMKRLRLSSKNGAAHNRPWGDILITSGLDQISKADRWALRECIENLDAIIAWREAMDPVARNRHNHPRRIIEHWRGCLPHHVDEPWRHDQAGGVDSSLGRCGLDSANFGDLALSDANICAVARHSRAVDHVARGFSASHNRRERDRPPGPAQTN